MSYAVAKLWNQALKNGGSSNMAVNGSGTPQIFSLTANASSDFEIQSMCLIAEFTGSVAIGNKFIADAVATLANGLLVEAKVDDEAYSFGNLKRTRDLVEVSQPQGGFNVIAGTTSLLQIFFFIPPHMRLVKTGEFSVDDYVRATVRDNLNGLGYLEIFLQGVKL
jgi:hypothetical protein